MGHPVLVGAADQVDEVGCLDRAPEAAGDIGDLDTLVSDLGVTDDGDEVVAALAACAHPGADRPGCFEAGPQTRRDQVIHQPTGSGVVLGADRENADLDRSEPQRQPPLVLLQQGRHHPLHGADGAAVDHHHPLPAAVGRAVGQVESLRLVEVQLHGRDGLFMAAAVSHLQVELRAVKCRLAGSVDQAQASIGEVGRRGGRPECRLRGCPLLGSAQIDGAVIAPREPYVVHREPEDLLGAQRRPQRAGRLVGDLVRAAEHVGVVEIDLPDPAQPRQHPGPLGPEHRGEFVESDRQITVGALRRGVDQRVMRAVGRPQHQLVAAHRHRREHVVAELGPVPGALEQRPFTEHRGVDALAAVGRRELGGQPLQLVADYRAIGQP